MKDGLTLLSEVDKKDQTWILLSALQYDKPVKLQCIGIETKNDATPQIVDVSTSLAVVERYFLDDDVFCREIKECIRGVNVGRDVATDKMIWAIRKQMIRRLKRKL